MTAWGGECWGCRAGRQAPGEGSGFIPVSTGKQDTEQLPGSFSVSVRFLPVNRGRGQDCILCSLLVPLIQRPEYSMELN